MTTVDDPMSLDDALRIIRNVSEHNTRDVPSQADIAEAIGVSITNAATNLEQVRETVAFMTGLVDQMQVSLVRLWELLKGLER